MDKAFIEKVLNDLYAKKIDPEQGFNLLKNLAYEDIGFAHIDHHRGIRKGFPEVIYCEGKLTSQIVEIVKKIIATNSNLLATRADKDVFKHIKNIDSRAEYNELGRTIVIKNKLIPPLGKILIVTAGTSDIPVAEEAASTADILGSNVERLYDVGVAGIHRLFNKLSILHEARVIIVVAGMEGALVSVIGGLVDKPVIAVPTSVGYGTSFNGIAALLSMLNTCASGVATVNIDNGFGAGYIAHKINILSEHQQYKGQEDNSNNQ